MTTQDILFIASTFGILSATFIIATFWNEIRNFLVGFYLDCFWKIIVAFYSFKMAIKWFRKHSKLTIQEEIELANNSFDNELGIGA